MIVVFGGVQIDRPDAEVPRFPESQVADVSSRVRVLLSSLRPRLVLGAAASGADLVVLEQALAAGLRPQVVLPFPVDRFEETSVASRGAGWVDRYRRVVAEVEAGRGEVEILGETEDDEVYVRTNGRLLERAGQLLEPEEAVVVLVLRPAPSNGRSVTDDLAARAELAGLLVLDLDCLVRPADRPSAFVAMPYGKKKDPQTGVEIDCDLVFNQVYVPVLEDLDYRWQRSDRETDTGIVHIGMIEAIANSDLVIADLATLNANVLYEVGLRHALADKATVLTAPDFGSPAGTRGLFDIDFIRRISYSRTVDGLTDRQVVDSIRTLRPALVDAAKPGRPVDSPVFIWFNLNRPSLAARSAVTAGAQRELLLRDRVRTATARRSQGELLSVAEQLDDPAVAVRARQAMRLELAVALREQGAYPDAVRLLDAVPTPTGQLRTLWLQQHALALRRLGEQQAVDGDPDPLWARAEELLNELLVGEQRSAETCGLAAGLSKRRFARFLLTGPRDAALRQLDRMIELYRSGFHTEPWDYYVGINLLAGLRLRGQRFAGGNAQDDLSEARELLPVVRLMTDRLPPNGRSFWVAITEAELVLHAYLLDDPAGQRPADGPAQAYAHALAGAPPLDHQRTARDQLEIFRQAGDPPEVIDTVLSAFPAEG